jgi:hypothetical protein
MAVLRVGCTAQDTAACVSGRSAGLAVILCVANGGPAQEVHGIAPEEDVIGWREDSRSVYVSPAGGPADSIPLSIVEISTGKRSAWKTIHPSQPVLHINNLHVTPDGRAYAYNYETAQSDLYIAHGVR